jgi:hypothetical protein
MPAISAMIKNVTTQLSMVGTSGSTFCFDISAIESIAHRQWK